MKHSAVHSSIRRQYFHIEGLGFDTQHYTEGAGGRAGGGGVGVGEPGGQQVPLRMWSKMESLRIDAVYMNVMSFILRKFPFSSA